MTSNDTLFTDVLLARGLEERVPEGDLIYERMIGSWTVRVVDHMPDGTSCESQGEWHFANVLQGLAVQDVFIVPMRGLELPPGGKRRYGTTLRFFEPESGDWIVTWINPVSGARNVLSARASGSDIVQVGSEPNGDVLRWCFRNMSNDTAMWTGERSTDGGETWDLEVEFFLSRLLRQ